MVLRGQGHSRLLPASCLDVDIETCPKVDTHGLTFRHARGDFDRYLLEPDGRFQGGLAGGIEPVHQRLLMLLNAAHVGQGTLQILSSCAHTHERNGCVPPFTHDVFSP
jgi:hypothetical protein